MSDWYGNEDAGDCGMMSDADASEAHFEAAQDVYEYCCDSAISSKEEGDDWTDWLYEEVTEERTRKSVLRIVSLEIFHILDDEFEAAYENCFFNEYPDPPGY